MVDYCICMGSSIGIASGMAKATKQKIESLIGDSIFFHVGIPPLINAVHQRANIMVVVLDNRTTAMTGGQPNPSIPILFGWCRKIVSAGRPYHYDECCYIRGSIVYTSIPS